MKKCRTYWNVAIVLLGLLISSQPSLGLVIIDPTSPTYGSPTGNTSAPVGFPYWSNIYGNRIHVGNGYYLTTNHSGLPGGFSWTQLKYSDGSPIDSDIEAGTGVVEAHPVVPIITSPVTQDEALLIVGDGRRRENDLTYWDITYVAGDGGGSGNDVWTETAVPGDAEAAGFKVTGSGKRWGTNEVAVTSVDVEFSGPTRMTRMFASSFTASGGTEWEAQGTNNDSDGVAFVFRDGQWQLAGLIHAVGGIDESADPDELIGFDNHPGGDSSLLAALISYESSALNDDPLGTYTSATFFSDLSFYNDQLAALGFGFALPEPATFMIVLIGATALGGRCRRATRHG